MARIWAQVTAPAPRFLLRLDLIDDLLSRVSLVRRFAEVGPGRGDLALHLSDRWPDAEGWLLDFAESTIATLQQRLAGRPQLQAQCTDFVQQFPGRPFDLVVACEVLEHIEDDAAALNAIAGALVPGGWLLLSVPAFMRKWQRADEAGGHMRRYEYAELKDKLATAGFGIETFWCYGFPLIPMLYPLRHLYYGARLHRDARAATEASGVERGFIAHLPVLPMWLALRPFAWLQRLTLERDWGDGFLVLARRS